LHRYFLLPLILLVTSIGFSSAAFAADDSALYSLESDFYISFDYNLIDSQPITLEQFAINHASDSISSPYISSTNISDDLTYSTEVSNSHSMIPSETSFDTRDEIISLLGLLLFAIPFGTLVFRMSDEESLSIKYLKLCSVVLVLGMVSLLTAQTARCWK